MTLIAVIAVIAAERVAPLTGILENAVVVFGAVKDVAAHTITLFIAHGVFIKTHHAIHKGKPGASKEDESDIL